MLDSSIMQQNDTSPRNVSIDNHEYDNRYSGYVSVYSLMNNKFNLIEHKI